MGWGEFFALSSALTWALGVILLRRSGESLPPFELNLFKNCFGLLLMIPTLLIFSSLEIPAYTISEWFIVFASGLLGIALADTLYLQALNAMGASRTGIVASLFAPFVILLSTLFLGERMAAWQWLGFFLVIMGVLLVTWRVNRSEVDSAHVRKGAFLGAAAMFFMAVGVVMVKDILETQPFLWTLNLRMAGGVAGMFVFILVRGRWASTIASYRRPQPWGTVLTASFLAAYLSLMMWLAGYKLIDASVAAVLNETNGAFIIILAWLMLGEKISRRKLAGISLTLSGVLVMILN
jgi:drug/metabolite transporter (DMT)-like permease